MKIFVSNLLFTFLFLFDLSYSQNDKFVVSILDFTGEDVNPKLLRMCYQRLETSLIESNKFMVIEKGQRDEILKEQKFQHSGCTDSECAVEIGQLINADLTVIGTVSKFGSTYTIDSRIINVGSGRVLESAYFTHTGNIDQLVKYGIKSVARELLGVKTTLLKKVYNTAYNNRYIIGGVSFAIRIACGMNWIVF